LAWVQRIFTVLVGVRQGRVRGQHLRGQGRRCWSSRFSRSRTVLNDPTSALNVIVVLPCLFACFCHQQSQKSCGLPGRVSDNENRSDLQKAFKGKALNMMLPAFAAECRRMQHISIDSWYAAPIGRSAANQPHTLLLSLDWTDRRTDTRSLYRLRSA